MASSANVPDHPASHPPPTALGFFQPARQRPPPSLPIKRGDELAQRRRQIELREASAPKEKERKPCVNSGRILMREKKLWTPGWPK
ncbi:hypothetical protein N7456_004483 [Penicillium angulare]|uniref:Uncharacterized protein n=1 Tax=Penicillium angulare TaxID=116970 RepID=A0A9W9FWS5_9EURO|nr:hypothetical protein N7456_004483 [Penicillium angulare]